MQAEQVAVPIVIDQLLYVYEESIEQETCSNVDFRKLRFNLAIAILDLMAKIKKLPYCKDHN